MPTDVYASLLPWRRSRLGLEAEEDDVRNNEGDARSSVGGASASKRSRPNVVEAGVGGSQSVSGPHATRIPLPESRGPPRGSLQAASIQGGFQRDAKTLATCELTRLFVRCAIPFHVAKTTQWRKTMKAISRIGCEWEGPTSEALRTRELQREKSSIEERLLPLRETWKKYGCTILCDGWSDVRRRSVYNVLVSCCKGTMFLKAIDASLPGVTIIGAFIYNHIRQAIIEVGAENVVHVITDNGSNCVSMGRMLEDEFPAISWTPCASHSLDLLIEDVGKIEWVKPFLMQQKAW